MCSLQALDGVLVGVRDAVQYRDGAARVGISIFDELPPPAVDGHRVQVAEREGLRRVPGGRQRHRRTSCLAIVLVPGVGSGRVVTDWRSRMRMARLLAAASN